MVDDGVVVMTLVSGNGMMMVRCCYGRTLTLTSMRLIKILVSGLMMILVSDDGMLTV
jgi:hypothetical protein